MSININQLASLINRELQRYANRIEEDVDAVAKEVAKDGAQKLKATSPKNTGDYAEGWTYKKVDNAYVVHNKNKPQITHLLEKSHVQRDGSRSTPEIHIKPVEESMVVDFERKVFGVIE